MANVLTLRKGYQLVNGQVVLKPERPKTLSEAKKAVESVFEKNRWDERSRLKYLEMHGVEPKDISKATLAEVRTILAAMEKSRMVLFR